MLIADIITDFHVMTVLVFFISVKIQLISSSDSCTHFS